VESKIEHTNEQPVSVAFVGAGRMACEHARSLRDIPGVSLSGVCSRTRGRAEKFAQDFDVGGVCGDIESLWASTGADLLVVAVSELATIGVCESAFAHNWVCLVEKPVGHNLEEARQIHSMAAKRSRPVFAALNRRHYHATRSVLKDLEARPGPRLIQILDQEAPAAATAAGRPAVVVENWMYTNSIHVVDYARVFGRGEVEEVVVTLPWEGRGTRAVAATIHFGSGDTALYQSVWDMPGPWSVTVTTSDARWEMRPLERAGLQLAGTRTVEWVPQDPVDEAFKAGFRRQGEEIVKAVRGEVSTAATLGDALSTMELIGQIYAG
jgi:predicted dehydrogenase